MSAPYFAFTVESIDETIFQYSCSTLSVAGLLLVDFFDFKCPVLHLELNLSIGYGGSLNFPLFCNWFVINFIFNGSIEYKSTALCSNTGILKLMPCKCQYLAIFSKKLSLTLMPYFCATLLILDIYFNGSLNSSAVGSKTGASGGALKMNFPFSIRLTGSINFPSGHSFWFGSSISKIITRSMKIENLIEKSIVTATHRLSKITILKCTLYCR
ncbi:hypothetical protein AGLY_018049 [Aphis glycines]|uniref:Uncharacterized protein n=1 Tax=Aphis glycines TaxID=307491 RepID=A0A6G0STB4_APHGL|nr:hypothetical protein AGLY_018049 [Aphis glycines]